MRVHFSPSTVYPLFIILHRASVIWMLVVPLWETTDSQKVARCHCHWRFWTMASSIAVLVDTNRHGGYYQYHHYDHYQVRTCRSSTNKFHRGCYARRGGKTGLTKTFGHSSFAVIDYLWMTQASLQYAKRNQIDAPIDASGDRTRYCNMLSLLLLPPNVGCNWY